MKALNDGLMEVETPESLKRDLENGSFKSFPEKIMINCPCCMSERVAYLKDVIDHRATAGLIEAAYNCVICDDTKIVYFENSIKVC